MLKFDLPPRKKFKLNLYLVYLIPILVGLIARFNFFRDWFASPFHYYHTLVGLDMRKFIVYGERFYHGKDIFSPYRLFVAIIYGIAGKDILPEALVMGQIILGLLSIALTIYVTLSISGRKSTAFMAGLFMSLYAPVIIYETQILKASIFLFLSLLSLAALLFARKKHFSNVSSLIAGAIAILPFFVRYAGFLWFVIAMVWFASYCRLKIIKKCGICLSGLHKTYPNFKPLFLFISGSLVVFLVVIAVNKKNNFSTTYYFFPNYSYIFSAGADTNGDISAKGEVNPVDTGKPKAPTPSETASKTLKIISHYAIKAYYVFNNFEMPNNINYYFIQQKLRITKFFIGPALLMPLALTGMILIIIYGGLKKKESILFCYIVAFAVPICAFLPLGRYKLVLAPIFCIAAAYATMYLYQIFNRKSSKLNNILVPSLMAVLFFLTISTVSYPKRSSDEKAYGLGAIYLPDQLMEKGKFKEASEILAKYYHENPQNTTICIYYASSLLGCNRPKDAEFVLNLLGIPNDSIGHYFYVLGECYRIQGRKQDAIQCYAHVLDCPCQQKLKNLAKQQLHKLIY